MLRTLFSGLVVLALAYAALCAALFFFQRSLIYFPQPRSAGAAAQRIALPTPVGDGLATTRPSSGADALLYFGGNAEDVSLSLRGFAAAFPEHAIVLVHYRGYGGSAGSPSEAALIEDGLVWFDKVRAEHPNVTLVGRSLGSGVAVRVAAQRSVARLVLVTPYDSLEDLAASQFPMFPVRWLLRGERNSWIR